MENITACGAEARVWTNYATALLRIENVTVPKYLYSINIPADGSLCSVSSVVYTLSQHYYYWCSLTYGAVTLNFIPDYFLSIRYPGRGISDFRRTR